MALYEDDQAIEGSGFLLILVARQVVWDIRSLKIEVNFIQLALFDT